MTAPCRAVRWNRTGRPRRIGLVSPGVDLDRADWRTFRLDRLIPIPPAGRASSPGAAAPTRRLHRRGDHHDVYRYRCRATFFAPARRSPLRSPHHRVVTPIDAATCEVVCDRTPWTSWPSGWPDQRRLRRPRASRAEGQNPDARRPPAPRRRRDRHLTGRSSRSPHTRVPTHSSSPARMRRRPRDVPVCAHGGANRFEHSRRPTVAAMTARWLIVALAAAAHPRRTDLGRHASDGGLGPDRS